MTDKNKSLRIRTLAMLLVLSVLLVSADQFTKYLVRENLEIDEKITLIDGFSYITHWKNQGVIFGLFADLPDDIRVLALSGLTLLALAGLCFFARTLKKKDILPRLAVSAIVAGAIGNQLDRILFGEVTDFILFIFGSRAFPAFNLADSCIFLGVCALVFDTFFTGCKAEKEEINVEEKGNKE